MSGTIPEWMVPEVGEHQTRVSVNADLAYPSIIAEIGLPRSGLNQYWLEVIHHFMKLEVQAICRPMAPSNSILILVDGPPGYKERWGAMYYPQGPMENMTLKQAALDAKAIYEQRR